MNIDGKEAHETDIVVIGSGAGGMASALTAAEGGAEVIIFEKLRHHGGTSNFAQGLFAVGSNMQKQRYIGLTPMKHSRQPWITATGGPIPVW